MNYSRTQRSVINTVIGFINKAITLLIPFFIRTIIIHEIGSNFLGLNSLYTSILNVLSLAELGVGSALVFEMYSPAKNGDKAAVDKLLSLYRQIYRIVGAVVLTLGLILIPFLKYLVDFSAFADTGINLYIVYLINLINAATSYFFFAYKKSILNAFQRRDLISIANIISQIVLYALQIVFLKTTKNYYLYCILLPVFTVTENIICSVLVSKKYPGYTGRVKTEKKDFLKVFSNIRYLLGHKIGAVIISSSDSIVISALLGIALLTKYSNYHYVIQALIGFLNVGYNAILASVGNALVGRDPQKALKLFEELQFVIFLAVSFCSACLIGLYQSFILIWVGEDFLFGLGVMALFVLYFYSWQIRIIGLNFKDAAGMWKEDWLKPYVGMAVNIVLNIVLGYFFGVSGVLISTIVVMTFIYFPCETQVLYKHLFQTKPTKEYFRYILNFITTSIVCCAVYFISLLVPDGGIWWFICKIAVVVVSSAVALLVCVFLRPEFKMITDRLRGLINGK